MHLGKERAVTTESHDQLFPGLASVRSEVASKPPNRNRHSFAFHPRAHDRSSRSFERRAVNHSSVTRQTGLRLVPLVAAQQELLCEVSGTSCKLSGP